MTIATTPVSAATAAQVASQVNDKATIAGNFTTFLQLLTTQLKNQNPLDPLDTNQFTQQLTQFAQVVVPDEDMPTVQATRGYGRWLGANGGVDIRV